jgi:aerobic-type carbon monoxide dehydrogenase small subunit (CoxS/CutS family)
MAVLSSKRPAQCRFTRARQPLNLPRAEVEARILEAMDGHICRCTGYVRYYTALREMILADPKLTP